MKTNTKSKRIGSKSVVSPLHGTDGQLMAMAAVDYCLNRRTYIVGSCIDWVRRWWDEFEPGTQNCIVRDIVEHIQDTEASPGDFDRRDWKALAEWAWEKLDVNRKFWVRQAVAHRRAAWPLGED